MGLAAGTVHAHVKSLYRHFGVNRRPELLAHFLRRDVVRRLLAKTGDPASRFIRRTHSFFTGKLLRPLNGRPRRGTVYLARLAPRPTRESQ